VSTKNFVKAKKEKNDEFYTRLIDIEKELQHYIDYFNKATIYMNCDDPEKSNFWKYFVDNFKSFNIKKIISIHFEENNSSYKLEFNGDKFIKSDIKNNGDFRNQENIDLLQQSDIIITNPPFSLFIEYILQLIKYSKNFLIIGNFNAMSYKEIFPLVKNNRMWVGVNKRKMKFIDQDGNLIPVNACWFTNLKHNRRYENIILHEKYSPEKYPKYDNYNAIEVSRVNEIPKDYDGVMGVPITFLEKYNPEQFEILGNSNCSGEREHLMNGKKFQDKCAYLNGESKYSRVFIRNKVPTS
jgi:hypothetical protein